MTDRLPACDSLVRRPKRPAQPLSTETWTTPREYTRDPTLKNRDMTTVRKVPTFDEMMWPTLLALKRMGGSASNQELLTCVMKLMAIPEEVQNLPHGDGPK